MNSIEFILLFFSFTSIDCLMNAQRFHAPASIALLRILLFCVNLIFMVNIIERIRIERYGIFSIDLGQWWNFNFNRNCSTISIERSTGNNTRNQFCITTFSGRIHRSYQKQKSAIFFQSRSVLVYSFSVLVYLLSGRDSFHREALSLAILLDILGVRLKVI